MKKNTENYLKIGLGLISMALLIYIGNTLLGRLRLDLTQESLYTLSDGTKSVLSKLDSPIKLKLYYSKTAANKGSEGLRAFNNYYLYVHELLRQYVSQSKNQLSLQVIDPRPDTSEEEDAEASGLKRFNLSASENYFFGLVAENESGSEKVIEFFDPGQKDKLEYQLTKLIYTVQNPGKKTIGVLSSIPVMPDHNGYMQQLMRLQGRSEGQGWLVMNLLQEFYQVKKIEQTEESITGVDTLLVVHPKGFPEKTLFAIDQFLMNGGSLMVLVDPYAVFDSASSYGETSRSPDEAFSKLMDKWGIKIQEDQFAGDKYLSQVARMNPGMPPSRILGLLGCDQRCVAKYDDPITSGTKNALFIYPGVLTTSKVDGVQHFPLMSTTQHGNSYSARGYELNNPASLWSKFQEGKEPVIFSYKAIGKFKTAFPDGIKTDDKKTLKSIAESKKEAAVVVFADVDFLADRFAFQNTFLGPAASNDNSTLLLNGLEALSGDLDLMSVRSKGRIERNFEAIDAIEFEAEKRTEDKVREINSRIAHFQSELNKLGSQAHEGNIALLQNEGIKKKKELAMQLAVLKKELRSVKREGREKVENIGTIFQFINTLLVPILVVGLGIWYMRRRSLLVNSSGATKQVNDQTNYQEVNA